MEWFKQNQMSIKSSLRAKKINLKVLIPILIVCCIVCYFGGKFFAYLTKPVINLNGKSTETVYIPTAADINDVRQLLLFDGWLTDENAFNFVASLMHYSDNVKPGRYTIKDQMTARQLISLLRSGNQTPVKVTFNSLRTREQLAGIVARYLETDSATLLAAMRDTAQIHAFGFSEATIPAMFIPNTYQFFWTCDGAGWMQRMHAEYEKFWNDTRRHKADSIGLSPVEVSILASIIEEETNKIDEMPIIAGLYLNRLRINMLLQACPTLKYSLGDFTIRRLTTADKSVESPYNTYKYAGLPPGPIRIPSVQALDAVLNADNNKYLYMCARPDDSGRNCFARTLKEHNRNAAQYQQYLNRKKIYR